MLMHPVNDEFPAAVAVDHPHDVVPVNVPVAFRPPSHHLWQEYEAHESKEQNEHHEEQDYQHDHDF